MLVKKSLKISHQSETGGIMALYTMHQQNEMKDSLPTLMFEALYHLRVHIPGFWWRIRELFVRVLDILVPHGGIIAVINMRVTISVTPHVRGPPDLSE
jgi:hypothetical protein